MGLPIGSIIEATVLGNLNGQRIMSVFHYRVTVESTIIDPALEIVDFNESWFDPAVPLGFAQLYSGSVPENHNITQSAAQVVAPLRRARVTQNVTLTGARAAAAVPNTAVVITKRTAFAGRDQIGSVHLPLDPATDAAGGFVDAALKSVLEAFAAGMLLDVTGTAGGGVYTPVIWHRDAAAPDDFDTVTNTVVQDTTRVMRRRTVGLGQ